MSAGITAWLVQRFGPKPVMYPAMVSAAVGLLLFATAGQHAHYFPQIFFAFLLMGAGAGASFVPLLQIGMSEIPNVDAGLGSGIVNVSQQMAGAIGLAALSTIAANDSKSLLASGHNLVSALTHGYQLALLIAAGCVALGLVALPDRPAIEGVARGAAGPHQGEHGQPRVDGAPRPLELAPPPLRTQRQPDSNHGLLEIGRQYGPGLVQRGTSMLRERLLHADDSLRAAPPLDARNADDSTSADDPEPEPEPAASPTSPDELGSMVGCVLGLPRRGRHGRRRGDHRLGQSLGRADVRAPAR